MNARGLRCQPGFHIRSQSITAAVAALVAFSTAAAAQTPVFARDDVASLAGARAIVSADFNRDGRLDLAHANTGRNSVTILLNQIGGGFARAADVAVGAGPFDMTTADFNRDGIADLAVANADGNSISVLLGKGDGTFGRSDIAAPGQGPRGIAAADVNRDGKPDLVYSAFTTGAVQVLAGNGAGGFANGAVYTSTTLQPQGLVLADFNHDGSVDVAVAYAGAAGLRILYGDGGTRFTARSIGGEVNLNVVAMGDFDRDGWVDLAAASTANSKVAIYRGGSAGFVRTAGYIVGSSPRGIAIGDINGDGRLDVVTANRASSTVSVLLGSAAQPGALLAHQDVAAGSGSRAAAIGDFDGDGRLDVATGNEFASSMTMLSNRTFGEAPAFAFHHESVNGADSFAEFVARGPAVSLPTKSFDDDVAVGDINGDGRADVAYASRSPNTVGARLADGLGGFVTAPTTAWPHFVLGFALGDVSGDGRPDFVSTGGNGAGGYFLDVGLGRGDGTFAPPGITVPLPSYAPAVALADINRDGKLDAVVMFSGARNDDPSEVGVWLGDGRGALAETSIGVAFVNPYGVEFDVADINRDGFVDIVAFENHQMAVALGSADGFAPPIYSAVPDDDSFSSAVAIGDLNLDGRLDAALGSGQVMFGDGDGTFSHGGRFDYEGGSVRVADFTGDGLPDIAAANFFGGAVILLANTRDHTNHEPTVDVGPDVTVSYGATQGEDCDVRVKPLATDSDAHALTYEWRRDGVVFSVSNQGEIGLCGPAPGTTVFTLTVRDGRGGEATDSLTMTIPSIKEIVLWAADASVEGRWTQVADSTAAGGVRIYDPNLGAPKVPAPDPQPYDKPGGVAVFRFYADPNETYKLWVRLKADGNSWTNDSVWLQFHGATDVSGTPRYEIGTTSGLAINLEECSGCGLSGWGWEDDGWGTPNRNGVLLRFPKDVDRDPQGIIIQTREDGVSIDQIVLSAEKYLTVRPGTAKNDKTILPSTPIR